MIFCEHQGALDIRPWARAGWLVPGRRSVAPVLLGDVVAGSVEVVASPNGDGVRISWQGRSGPPVSLFISTDSTPVHFGGHRSWFLCPRCHGRVGLLYFAGDVLRCRKCLRLTYECQGEWAEWRGSSRAEKILRRLGADPDEACTLVIPDKKPPRLRWRTYDRLVAIVYRAQQRRWGAIDERASRLAAREAARSKKSAFPGPKQAPAPPPAQRQVHPVRAEPPPGVAAGSFEHFAAAEGKARFKAWQARVRR